jgi:hypothetical protein
MFPLKSMACSRLIDATSVASTSRSRQHRDKPYDEAAQVSFSLSLTSNIAS